MGVCSNELQCVAFASSRNYTRGSIPQEGTRCIIFLFFYANLPLCVPSVSADFGCERTKDVAAKRKHTHTHTHRDNLSFIYYIDLVSITFYTIPTSISFFRKKVFKILVHIYKHLNISSID